MHVPDWGEEGETRRVGRGLVWGGLRGWHENLGERSLCLLKHFLPLTCRTTSFSKNLPLPFGSSSERFVCSLSSRPSLIMSSSLSFFIMFRSSWVDFCKIEVGERGSKRTTAYRPSNNHTRAAARGGAGRVMFGLGKVAYWRSRHVCRQAENVQLCFLGFDSASDPTSEEEERKS